MNDREIIDMTKKLPHGHNIGGGNNQKRRQEFKKSKSQIDSSSQDKTLQDSEP